MIFGPSVKKVTKWRHERNGEALLKALDSDNLAVKEAAIEALGHIQLRTASQEILKTLRHPISSSVRATSANALSNLRAVEAIPSLIQTLGDDNKEVREASKMALLAMGDHIYKPLRDNLGDFYHETIRTSCKSILCGLGSRTTDILIEGLREGTYGIREESAALLGQVGDSRGREALIEALADNRIEVRKAAASALKSIGWKPGNDKYAVHYYLSNGKVESAVAIGVAAIEPLQEWLQADDMIIRRKIAIGLRKLGWKPRTRKEAADFWAAAGKFSELAKLGPDATETLIRLLADTNVKVKKGAARILTQIGIPPQVKQLVKDINLLADYTFFMLQSGTFNLETIGLESAQHFRNKYYLLVIENCDSEQMQHINNLYPDAKVISENEAKAL